MARPVIELTNVSKRYALGERPGAGGTLRDALMARWGRWRARGSEHDERDEVWSLRDVNLSVDEGAALGIIGRNGAGKSTLLKILTRITEPTTGVARTRGRVGALLEVGTGFHPDLTGRENVYLNGALLGMTRRQIDGRYDEIVEFSGVERFLDTPVKRYSSGMYLRLAFAVAAHLQADILCVDEILAVGDAEFQRKCLGKMAEIEASGRTVLFVSHDLEAIGRLCPTSIWLEHGRIVKQGPTHEVVDAYLSAGVHHQAVRRYDNAAAPVALRSVALLDATGRPSSQPRRDEPITIEVDFEVAEPVPGLDLSAVVSTVRGLRVLDEAWSDSGSAGQHPPGCYRARLVVPPVLAVGDYSVGIWMGSAYESLLWHGDAVTFRLEGGTQNRPDRVVQLGLSWDVERIAPERD